MHYLKRYIYNDLTLMNFNKNAMYAVRAKGFNYKQKREKEERWNIFLKVLDKFRLDKYRVRLSSSRVR